MHTEIRTEYVLHIQYNDRRSDLWCLDGDSDGLRIYTDMESAQADAKAFQSDPHVVDVAVLGREVVTATGTWQPVIPRRTVEKTS